ncbi:MAG TPA: hypothetical protein P5336_08750, partial [Treponema sp.]|nr:hypothetical protein [Treponema sp.]
QKTSEPGNSSVKSCNGSVGGALKFKSPRRCTGGKTCKILVYVSVRLDFHAVGQPCGENCGKALQ